METKKKIMLVLLKDFNSRHTVSSIAKSLGLSRTGAWKIVKKLEAEEYILSEAVGAGKTAVSLISINWENPLVEKALSFYLAEESVKQRRWRTNFAELEKEVEFLILYGSILSGSKNAKDIDILAIVKKGKFVKIQKIIDKIQKTESKKIHMIDFTPSEFRKELRNNNKAFINALNNGVILFGQERFVCFMKNE